MKLQKPNSFARRESGMATILFIALLAIMILLVTANLGALAHLNREVKLLEQQQTQRLEASQTQTNTMATTQMISK
jgi:hypothetical protein